MGAMLKASVMNLLWDGLEGLLVIAGLGREMVMVLKLWRGQWSWHTDRQRARVSFIRSEGSAYARKERVLA